MSQQHTIVFPHFPKTGGTTVLYHFRKAYGDESIQVVGPFGRSARFFANEFQPEEQDIAEFSKNRVFQGHSVDEGTAAMAAATGLDVKLMVVLRHPVGLTKSRFSHKAKHVLRKGVTLRSENFLANDPANVMCRMLIRHFPGFIDDSHAILSEQAKSILRKFDYVFTTEMLDLQVVEPMRFLGLPEVLERRRVAETKLKLEISDEYLMQRHAEDLSLFESFNASVIGDGSNHNALGFDKEAKKANLAKVKRGHNAMIETAYAQLSNGICSGLMAEAALEKIASQQGEVALKDVGLFEAMLRTKWHTVAQKIPQTQLDISSLNLKKYQNGKLLGEGKTRL